MYSQVISVQFSCSVVFNSLHPHQLQHARVPCPSPTLQLAQTHAHQVGDAVQASHPVLSSSPPAFNHSQHQGLFKWVSSSQQVAKVLNLQLQHQSFQWVFRTDLLEDRLVWSPCSPRDSQESSPTPQSKASILWCSAFFMVQHSYSYMTMEKPYLWLDGPL